MTRFTVIAVDTNLLVYAHRQDLTFHGEAHAILSRLTQSAASWAIPWPCIHEFLAVVTNIRIFRQPTPLSDALMAITTLSACPSLVFIGESDGYLESLESVALPARVQGGAIHDARIAAIRRFHGVRELWSADRDFTRFSNLTVRNPLLSD